MSTLENTYKFNREHIKKSDMIGGYGAGKILVANQLKEDLKELYFDGVEDFFYQAQDNITPMVSVLKETFQTLWDDTRTDFTWTLPNGFKCHLKPVETVEVTVNPFGQFPITMIAKAIAPSSRNTRLGVSVIHSCDGYVADEMVVRCNYNAEALMNTIVIIDEFLMLYPNHKATSYHDIISASVIERLTEEDLFEYSLDQLYTIRTRCIQSLDYKPFPIKPIHDGFASHPNHDEVKSRIYSEIMAEITDGHLLESIIMELSGKPMARIQGDLTGQMVRQHSKYAIS